MSRQDQRPGLQADETGEFIERRGWKLIETYSDIGLSGAKDRRPGLEKMMAAARRREFDAIVVYRSDRLFRSLRHMVNTIAELAALGVAFVSATEPFDTGNPSGQLMLHLVSAFSEFERGVLIERVRSGVAAARRRGTRIGRPKAQIDIARALELRRQGVSVRKAAVALGVGAATLARALAEHEYTPAPKSPLAEATFKPIQVPETLEAA